MNWYKVASWVDTALGLVFWACIVLAFAVSAWWWLAAGVTWAAYLVLRIAGARDLLADLLTETLAPHIEQRQTGGDGSVNVQASKVTVSAARGQMWAGLGNPLETAGEREARERADYELTKAKLQGMRRHPAGGPDRPAS